MHERPNPPDFSPEGVESAMRRLLTAGAIEDERLARLCDRLDGRFSSYAACYAYPLWAPGLLLTNQMRSTTELYLPMAEIRQLFSRLFTCAFTSPACPGASLLSCASWLDLLPHLPLSVATVNPARLVRSLAASERLRREVLFALFLPRRHGGAFDRYPLQAAFVRQWLAANRKRLDGEVRCLDAACGTGEGTYDLARLVGEAGFRADRCLVEGSSLEPLEVAAAAHGYFPHDPARQRRFREIVDPLLTRPEGVQPVFRREDLLAPPRGKATYDLILCNGLLGGPLLHGDDLLEQSLHVLAGRLRPGGVLLVADRFHEGWKKGVPAAKLQQLLARSGLAVVQVGEGVGGVKGAGAAPPRRGRRRTPSSGPDFPV